MADNQSRILIVDDDAALRKGLERTLTGYGYAVEAVSDAETALERVVAAPPDLAIIDLQLPGKDGLELVADLFERGIESSLVVLTGHGSIDSAVEATRRGVFDYLVKPIQPDRLRTVIERGLERTALRREVQELRREMIRSGQLQDLVGKSPAMLELYRLIEQIAPTAVSVLIVGESGTGKEIVARTLHRLSPRASRPLVAVNCSAIPQTLLESELFGHEKGAFTGATAARTGCFEQAHQGTLFLDEIAEMPVELQSKLLRVLEDGKVRRVGGSREVEVDARIVSATNADIEACLRDGRFREDLYFRLNVFTVKIPPLRERVGDIPVLAEHFLREFAKQNPCRVVGFAEATLAAMKQHPWPGNARELRNAVHRAAIVCGEGEIQVEHLPPEIRTRPAPEPPVSARDGVLVPLGTSLAEAEKAIILRTLEECRGNKTRCAQLLGVSVKTLYNRLQEYGARSGPES